MATPNPSVIDVLRDPALLARHFAAPTWTAWVAFLRALFALPLSRSERSTFRRHTERRTVPKAVREAWLIVGRRGGKSRIAALVAVYLACFRPYGRHLAPGERATVMVIAADRRQARVVMRYIGGLLAAVPMLHRLVERQTQEAIDLANRVTIFEHNPTLEIEEQIRLLHSILTSSSCCSRI